jgi:hypothetical protein
LKVRLGRSGTYLATRAGAAPIPNQKRRLELSYKLGCASILCVKDMEDYDAVRRRRFLFPQLLGRCLHSVRLHRVVLAAHHSIHGPFRRHGISGWAKAIWVIPLIIFPLLAVLAYLITQSRGMAERNTQQAQQARDELRRVVGFSAADEIEKLDRLKKAGSITEAEFGRLRAKLVQ